MILKKHVNDYKYEKDPDSIKDNFEIDPKTAWNGVNEVTKRCLCCNTARKIDGFPLVFQDGALVFFDKQMRRRSVICRRCLPKIYEKFFEVDPEHDEFKTLYRMCGTFNFYYNDTLAHRIHDEKNYFEDGTEVCAYLTWVDLYFRQIEDDENLFGKSFYNSDSIDINHIAKYQVAQAEEESFNEEDRRNRLQIINTFHKDVFAKEPIEERRILMADLVTMIDDSMADDYVRQEAAVEIVRTFHRISKISNALQVLQKDAISIANNSKIIKELVDEKKKETDMVTAFSKDHGFAEKYALSKSRGSGTLSAIVRDINEKGYDKGAINKFDIDTAEAMKQVSDISAESIVKQLALSDSDYVEMVKEQAKIIRDMHDLVEQQAEELRLLKSKHLKQELLEEYKKDLLDKQIDEKEIDALVEEELKNPTEFSYREGK